jgi:hypothetical protein
VSAAGISIPELRAAKSRLTPTLQHPAEAVFTPWLRALG